MPYKDKEKYRAYQQYYFRKGVDAQRWRRIWNDHGLTKEDFVSLVINQDSKCALCRKPFEGLSSRLIHVDHCHETKRIRGILCMPCNVALGMLGDNEEGLLRAIKYIKGEL